MNTKLVLSLALFALSINPSTVLATPSGPLVDSVATVYTVTPAERYFAPLVLIQQPQGRVALLYCGMPDESQLPNSPNEIATFMEKNPCQEISDVSPVIPDFQTHYSTQLFYQKKSHRFVWLTQQAVIHSGGDSAATASTVATFDPSSPATIAFSFGYLQVNDGENLQLQSERRTWTEHVSGTIRYPQIKDPAQGYGKE